MANNGVEDKKVFCNQIRGQIGVGGRNRNANLQQMPSQESLEMMARLIRVRNKIDELEKFMPQEEQTKVANLKQHATIVERPDHGRQRFDRGNAARPVGNDHQQADADSRAATASAIQRRPNSKNAVSDADQEIGPVQPAAKQHEHGPAKSEYDSSRFQTQLSKTPSVKLRAKHRRPKPVRKLGHKTMA